MTSIATRLHSILVANRGEIALRVFRTARRLGMRCIAVYSDVDADAPFVRFADEAHRIGPAAARESYLRGDTIIAVAKATGAACIHPGYGFLSENADFADACQAAGIIFVGPPASAIRAMGLKDAAKALAEQANVPVVPGYHGARQDVAFLESEAARIGYPVLIKAVAGGGGKGMKRVDAAADFADSLESAQREARNAFGAHFKAISFELLDTDAIGFARQVVTLMDALTHPNHGWPSNDKSGSYWRNSGDTRRLHPLRKPG
jgi:3-methylcrotonyl-CoA carboxylase alpha subunit